MVDFTKKKKNSHNKQISRNMTPATLISTLLISIELNERERHPRLSLSKVSADSKARPQHQDLRAPLFSNSAWDLLRRIAGRKRTKKSCERGLLLIDLIRED